MSTIDPGQINTSRPPDGSGDPNSPVNYTSAEERGNRTDIQGQFQAAKTDVEALEADKADTTYVDTQDAATLDAANTGLNNHKVDAAAHGGVEAAFAAHDGATGAAHGPFDNTSNGFAPASGGGTTNYLRADGTWAEPPGTAPVTNPPSAKGQLWTHDGTINVVQPPGANGLVLETDNTTATGLKWGSKTGAGGGDVTGPASSVDSRLASFDGTTGKVIKDSGITQASVSSHIGDSSIHYTVASISHNAVGGRSTADAHPTSAITGLDAALAGKLDTAHNTDPSAHPGQFELSGGIAAHDADGNAHGGVENAFNAHQGGGGVEHAVVVPGGASGFMDGARADKVDNIEAGAQVNAVDDFNGRTGSISPSSGDYTAAQVTSALGTNISSTMLSTNGIAASTRTVPSGGTFTPNPLQGQYIELSGDLATTIGSMNQNGSMDITIPAAVAITLDSSWTSRGARPSGLAGLYLKRNGSYRVAIWH